MAERVVGVVFDESMLRGAECVRRRGGSVRVVAAAEAELPVGVVDQGEILDESRFADSLHTLWASGGFSTRRVAVGLDARAATIRRIELPLLEDRDARQAARYELAELVGYDADEAIISTVDLDPVVPEARWMLSLAVRARTLESFARTATAAGLDPVGTQLTQSALVTTLSGDAPLDAGMLGLVVSVNEHTTDTAVYDAGGMVFSRVITAGVGRSGASLFDELEMELAALEEFAGSSGSRPTGSSPPAQGSGLPTVLEGISRTLSYFTTEVDPTPIGRIVMSGSESTVSALGSALADAHPRAEVVRHRHAGWSIDLDDPGVFDGAVAVGGTVLTGPLRRDRDFDLRLPADRRRRAARRRVGAGVVAALALAPVLIDDGLSRRSDTADLTVAAEAAEAHADAVRAELDALTADRSLAAEVEAAQARIGALRAQEVEMTTVVRRLAEAIPDDVRLQSLRIQRSLAGELPTGYVGPAPVALLRLDGVAPDLDGVGRWLSAAETVDALDGLWLAQASLGAADPSGDRDGTAFAIDGAIVDGTAPLVEPADDGEAGG